MQIPVHDSLSPWLEELPYDWTDFAQVGQIVTFKKNQMIFNNNQFSENVFIVKKGRVRLFLISDLGDEKALAIVGKNGLLGECSLFQNQTYSVNAVTTSPVDLIKIPSAIFKKKVLDSPSHMLYTWELISLKTRLLSFHTLQLAFHSSLQRICDTFLQLGLTYGEKLNGNQIHIKIPFTHQELANLVGTTRVTVANHVKTLIEMDLISKKGKLYTIKNLDALLRVMDHPNSYPDFKTVRQK